MFKRYEKKEKNKLVNEVIIHGRSVADVAHSYGVSISTLHRWVNAEKTIVYTEKHNDCMFDKLRTEINVLRGEKEVLMHAIAIFAREFKK